MEVALLNPPQDAALARKLLGILKDKQEVLTRDITATRLDREDYIAKQAALAMLKELIKVSETTIQQHERK